jgi:hypothetical protein
MIVFQIIYDILYGTVQTALVAWGFKDPKMRIRRCDVDIFYAHAVTSSPGSIIYPDNVDMILEEWNFE